MLDMDYIDFKTPFLGNSKIREKAESFRKEFWNDEIPVDIEKIIELKLEICIIPVSDLTKRCDTDALISSNWESLYVDKDKYLDERYDNRLRFSLAHEIGHFVLHKEIYKQFNIKSLEDFYSLITKIPQQEYSYIEIQANKFANYFLIPRDILLKRFSVEKNRFSKNKLYNKIDSKTINSYIAIPLAKTFFVSEETMEIALNDINADNNK